MKRKFNYYKVLQGNYGSGWDDLVRYDMSDPEAMKELRQDRKDYRREEPGISHRMITRRVPVEKDND